MSSSYLDNRPYLKHPRPRKWKRNDTVVIVTFVLFSFLLIGLSLLFNR